MFLPVGKSDVAVRRDVRYVINCTFDQPIIANDNCLSFAGLFLFPKSTKYLLGSPDLRCRYHTATNPYFATFCPIFFLFRENCIKKCHSFPSHLSLYFIKYAPSILFLKILKYYNSTILHNSPKKSHFCATFAHSMHIFKYFHTFF